MSINARRSVLHQPRNRLRTLLLSLVAVSAVVIGLLAMHSLNFESERAVASTAAMGSTEVRDTAAMPLADDIMTVAACDAACGAEDFMPLIACIIAALVITLAWAGTRIAIQTWGPRFWLAAIPQRLAGLPLPSPPSLHILSISRT